MIRARAPDAALVVSQCRAGFPADKPPAGKTFRMKDRQRRSVLIGRRSFIELEVWPYGWPVLRFPAQYPVSTQ